MQLNDNDTLHSWKDGETCVSVSLPGHTNDSMGFFFTKTKALFTGDAGGTFEDGMIHSPFLTDCTDYLNSLDRIIALQPRVLCIAHNAILKGDDIECFLKESKKSALKYRDRIYNLLNTCNGDIDRVVNIITQQEYDSKTDHIQKREPFILNLTAMVKAVAKTRA